MGLWVPHGKVWDNKQNTSLAYLVSVCSATEQGLPVASAPSVLAPLPSLVTVIWEWAETARGVEVEEEGLREMGRMPRGPRPLTRQPAGPQPDPEHGNVSYGQPEAVLLFL